MTNEELDKNRVKIVKEYLATGEILNLEGDMDICVTCSTPGTYHVFFDHKKEKINNKNKLTHQYSMSNVGLKNLAEALTVNTIKRIYIQSKYIKLRNQKQTEFNPLDFENQK